MSLKAVELGIGDNVRYRGVGAGCVSDRIERPFRGRKQSFAVIFFPHRDMKAQVPVDDPAVQEKLEPLLSRTRLRELVRKMDSCGKVLPRTWDQREELGQRHLRKGGPVEWMTLIASYALAERHGVALNSSDHELVHQALELFASELACAEGEEYLPTLETLEERYDRLSEPVGPVEEGAHFASPAIVKQVPNAAVLA